ncbi:MAG: FkbM family methyltransferase [Patiriisocius sp.]|jgi:FkbM family methyltransferase|tara:strand:- start:537 stop:1382 length:846 start_codon:yes stop_codon:yes gene_type:complete
MSKKLKYFFRTLKSKKRKKIFGPNAKGIIYDSKNGYMALPISDITIGKNLGFKGHWNFNEIQKLLQQTTQDDVIYFIGTHVGTLLVPIAKKVKTVVGFEANEDTFWFIKANLCLNKISNATIFNKAVGDGAKKVTFYKNTVNTGGSKIKPIKDSILYNYDNPKQVEVDMVALDPFISEQSLTPPSGIIMDIEGAEYFALKGMQATLAKVRFLYVEFVPHHLQNVSNTSVEKFLKTMTPHFSKAIFLKDNTQFDISSSEKELVKHLKILEKNNVADDILFTK